MEQKCFLAQFISCRSNKYCQLLHRQRKDLSKKQSYLLKIIMLNLQITNHNDIYLAIKAVTISVQQ